ncbi:MAG: hypothetical protein HY553_20730 [Elusimicrobia bacterium]|nr:hypothetical protein [Elusimicrobiota bacterium]
MTRALPVAASVLLTCGLTAAAALSRPRAYWLYGHASYWCMLSLALLWSWLAVRRLRPDWKARWAGRRVALAVGLGAAALVFTAVPPRFRVLSDETNLLGVALSMASEKTAYNPTVAKRYFGSLHPLNREIEKRPLLFPFLVHVAHVATGYRWQNGFGVNFVLFAFLLACVYRWASRGEDAWAGAAAVALVATYPLVAFCAGSSNAELLQVTAFGAMIAALASYLRAPDAESWTWLWASSLVFAHTRYECFLFAGLTLAWAAYCRAPEREWFLRFWPVYAVTPLTLLPLAWQRILIPRPFENAPGQAVFSAGHLARFAGVVVKTLAKPYDPIVPHAVGVLWAAAGCAAFAAYERRLGRGPRLEPWQARALAAGVACLALQALLFLCYYFGDFVHPASARFFLPVSVAAALAPTAFHLAFPQRLPRRALVAFAAAMAAVYLPVAVSARHTDTLELIREERSCRKFVLERADEHAFYIYSRPGQLTVLDQGAADFAWANNHVRELLFELDRRLYSDMFVFQRVSYATGMPVPDDRLHEDFRLELVLERQLTATQFLRISRVLR